jgi:putative endonuclease
MRRGYLYILTNKPYGTLYTGVTANLRARLESHRLGTASEFTRRYGLRRLVYYEIHDQIAAAIQRETSMKRWKRDWKIALNESINPAWRELDDTLI